jgi:hypothetical protein
VLTFGSVKANYIQLNPRGFYFEKVYNLDGIGESLERYTLDASGDRVLILRQNGEVVFRLPHNKLTFAKQILRNLNRMVQREAPIA